MDSGDPQTLISCCDWAITHYPARTYALILWNHGTGPLDPSNGRIINPTELFTFNPNNNKLELDRSIGFFDAVDAAHQQTRGICWDDSTGNYLTNQKLDYALNIIYSDLLHGEKFGLIGFDACLMKDLAIAHIVKKYAHIMVGSQEVELGMGWQYQRALSIFQQGSATPAEFGDHIVRMFGVTYSSITDDYTQSALDLSYVDALEKNVHNVATLLIEALQKQKKNSVKNAIVAAAHKDACTTFDEPSYKDMHHLYANIQQNLSQFSCTDDSEPLKEKIFAALEEGKQLIKKAVISNVTGKNLRQAHGLSIYFPERKIHYSYKKTGFAKDNAWIVLLALCCETPSR
jgi:hypothetical protein